MNFSNIEATENNRSYIEGKQIGKTHVTGNSGIIYAGDNNNVVMHETGHLVGLADRYEDLEGGNLGGKGTAIHPGYSRDLMGNGRTATSLDKSHYQHYLDMYRGASPNVKVGIGKIQVGRNEWGRLRTPYEKGGLHVKDPFAK